MHCINSVQTSPRVKGQTGVWQMRARSAADCDLPNDWPETGRQLAAARSASTFVYIVVPRHVPHQAGLCRVCVLK